ncbi:unnamed protein product [Peniophora sp. CBMAI 1063]|nr:unnamed protein product [Peniophora sp. CBMAI 1063]
MCTINPSNESKEALAWCQRKAQKRLGNADVLVEEFVARPRHIEVQVFAGTHGNAPHCQSLMRLLTYGNQKIIEEALEPGLAPELRADLCAKVVADAEAVKYVGAGMVEFILDRDDGHFYFMENTRLQVEHPVSEIITELELVGWQLEAAAGNPLPLT